MGKEALSGKMVGRETPPPPPSLSSAPARQGVLSGIRVLPTFNSSSILFTPTLAYLSSVKAGATLKAIFPRFSIRALFPRGTT